MMVGDNLPIESTTTDLINTELFIRLETGKITPNGFRQGLRSQYQIEGTDNEIDQAWNSLLKGLMPGSLEIAQSLARHYRIFILSNSNQIHFEALKDECRQFFQSFEALFLSYEIGFRKPEALIFEYMEKQVDIAPDHTMFIDDNLENVQSAAKRGYLAVVNPFNEIPGYLL